MKTKIEALLEKNCRYLELNLKNEDFVSSQIANILNLKVKKLSLSEQKIIALIRAVLRSPKYVLLENFFENLDEEHIELAKFLLNKIKESSTIIACEKDKTKLEHFKDFKTVKLPYSN